MEGSKTFSHRTVLLTGAAKRLGKEIALHFAKAGWNVVLHYGHSKDEALETLAQIKGFRVEAIALQANLASEVELRSLFKTSIERFHRIDCLINSASVFEFDRPSQADHPVTQSTLVQNTQVNLAAPVLLAQEMYRHLQKQQMRSDGLVPVTIQLLDQKLINLNPDYFSYTLSKSALLTATEMMALDFAPIMRSVGLAPGITLPSGKQTEAQFREAHRMTPMGYSSSASDIAEAALFIANAKAITGTTIYVDGGQHLLSSDRDIMFKIK
ncbi:FabG Dehydrogenases with different specificities (related to short-chain alcohol dehydrogenases) [Burkholderiaceae bacterium]